MGEKYVIGLDYGTLSCRAALVVCGTGEILADTVQPYKHQVMDQTLPDGKTKLSRNWALQHPQDYLDAMEITIKSVLEQTGICGECVIGIGIDFTSCTMLPIDKEGTPFCMKPGYESRPHAYVKLWKHHAAQYEADKINEILSRGQYREKYKIDEKVSSELLLPKAMQILDEDPQLYAEADQLLEAGDWLTRTLTGSGKRSASTAGYKAWWEEGRGYPEKGFYEAFDSRLQNFVEEKLKGEICPVDQAVGYLTEDWALRLGLCSGIAVAPAIIDSHAGVPGSGVLEKGQMMLVVGTSSVALALSDKSYYGKGIVGTVKNAIIPGYYALESGIAAVGDSLEWFVTNCVPESYYRQAEKEGKNIHTYLSQKAAELNPCESPVMALDWLGGNKTPYVDGSLMGGFYGITLQTKPEELYRALIEATAFGTRRIVESMEESGTKVQEVITSGGISKKNPFFMQIYADVLGLKLRVAENMQTAALGSAIYAAVAAGKEKGGYGTIAEAVRAMTRVEEPRYYPVKENQETYSRLYKKYKEMAAFFSRWRA